MMDHQASVMLASASNLLIAPEILGEVSGTHQSTYIRVASSTLTLPFGGQLGRAYLNFLQQEAADLQRALQDFGQWELDRFRSFEFFILLPLYTCLFLEPRSQQAAAVRAHWATLGVYAALFGLLGGQFGLYFYDIFEVAAKSSCRMIA